MAHSASGQAPGMQGLVGSPRSLAVHSPTSAILQLACHLWPPLSSRCQSVAAGAQRFPIISQLCRQASDRPGMTSGMPKHGNVPELQMFETLFGCQHTVLWPHLRSPRTAPRYRPGRCWRCRCCPRWRCWQLSRVSACSVPWCCCCSSLVRLHDSTSACGHLHRLLLQASEWSCLLRQMADAALNGERWALTEDSTWTAAEKHIMTARAAG